MIKSLAMERYRCVQETSSGGACHGSLALREESLTCNVCGYSYAMVQDVPVLRPESLPVSDRWFEEMYEERSRTEELQKEYLRSERESMVELARQYELKGPCLEVGCGTGLFAETVPDYIGLEYSLESLFAIGFETAVRVCADARRLPFDGASMECVFSFSTLEHVPDVDQAFAELDRVLQPGGLLVLSPAWHCTRYTTELIPVLPYSSLNVRQKITKALLPLIKSKPYKLLTKLPWRVFRRITQKRDNPLHWGRLVPYHGESWISDADAVASIDSHEGILYYTSRGYTCSSHPSTLQQLLAGHDMVILHKPGSDH